MPLWIKKLKFLSLKDLSKKSVESAENSITREFNSDNDNNN